MSKTIVNGATLQCNQGNATSSLTILPTVMCDADQQPLATIEDFIPMMNVLPFGMCMSMANPQVAAATAAAMGALTPQPCIPMTTAAWSPGSSVVTYNDLKALTKESTCNCQWAGVIQITVEGTQDVAFE